MKLFLLAAGVAATMLPPVAEAITFSPTVDYETFTAPTAGNYRFVVKGASGGGGLTLPFSSITTYGGTGVVLTSILNLAAGEVFHIVVGTQGSYGSDWGGSGGGGGSFAVSASNMVIAGGGGGAGVLFDGQNGQTGTSGGNGWSRGGGVGGYGGNGGYYGGGGGGGGLYGAGFEGDRYEDNRGGQTFYGGFGGEGGQDLRNAYSGALSNGDYFGLQGGAGTGYYSLYPGPPAGYHHFYGGPGGFGGGGGASWFGGSGGGGGFSGGGGGGGGSGTSGGGGGGSISTGTILSFGTNVGDGEISIDFVSSVPEPSTWAMLLSGFGLIGFALRRNRRRTVSIDSGPPNHGMSTV